MAYLAFYRLFRPTTFDKVVRQEHIVKILTNQIETGKTGHAYLFCGPRGTGKTSVAKIFARAVNCERPVNGSPCGECPTCKALADPSNLDIVEIDAASNNGVDQMRDLREKVQYPPVAGKYKVYIVDEVHMLTDSAFNAMLKTLEEPPRHAIFILATTEPHKLPATILSRCMRFDFKLLPEEDLVSLLRSVLMQIGKDYEEEALHAIARAGAGSARDTLSIADTCVSYDRGKLTFDAVNAVLGNADFTSTVNLVGAMLTSDQNALSLAEQFLSEGKDVGVLCKDVLSVLNQVSIAKLCREGRRLVGLPDHMYDLVKSVADKTDGHKILRTSEIFAETEGSLRYASSPRILFETAVVKACMPETDYNVDALLSRISALEKKIAEGSVQAVAISPEEPKRKETPKRKIIEEEAPPEEFFSFGAYEEPVEREVERTVKREESIPVKREEIPVKKEQTAVSQDVKNNAFGKFLRALRRLNRGGTGVLVTMCTELESRFDGDTFVLYTDKEVVYGTATREDNAPLVKEALGQIGITDYRVEFSGQAVKKDPLAQFEEDFKDNNIIYKE
ncbi:MAG: DNA polymerase III subunit gamma/tau [Clostridia bacterium]|nr:DNA polymerase III subunit gamma/tau [Clostridia bacterium]